jgi:hypothetical protein
VLSSLIKSSVKRRIEKETVPVVVPVEDDSLSLGEVCAQLEKLARAVTELQTSGRRPRTTGQLNIRKLTPELSRE